MLLDYLHDLPLKLQFFSMHAAIATPLMDPTLVIIILMTTFGILTSGFESVTVKGQDRLGTLIGIIDD